MNLGLTLSIVYFRGQRKYVWEMHSLLRIFTLIVLILLCSFNKMFWIYMWTLFYFILMIFPKRVQNNLIWENNLFNGVCDFLWCTFILKKHKEWTTITLFCWQLNLTRIAGCVQYCLFYLNIWFSKCQVLNSFNIFV